MENFFKLKIMQIFFLASLFLLFTFITFAISQHRVEVLKQKEKQVHLKMAGEILRKIDSRLIIFLENGTREIPTLIIFNDKESQKSIIENVELRGKLKYKYELIPAIATTLSPDKIINLANNSKVKRITLDHQLRILRNESIPLIKSNLAEEEFGINGSGINLAIIDTGIFNHTEFQKPNRIVKQKCYVSIGSLCPDGLNESNNATDDNGHGTHVAGIAAGKGNGYGSGVARNASLFAVKVLSAEGYGTESDIIKGIEWAVENGAHIISMSLGASYFEYCYDWLLSLAVDEAVERGVVVVVAAGNDGPYFGTIGVPACAKRVITVGSSQDGSEGTVVDKISDFSSRGPTIDSRIKPDLVAPGEWITSIIPGNEYYTARGTSMATPHVSGVAALVIQKFYQVYNWYPEADRVKAILLTSVNTTAMEEAGYTQRNNVFGSGRIDAHEAVRIINFTKNRTIATGEEHWYKINVSGGIKITLYWPENYTTFNNLDLVVRDPSGTNYSNPTHANDSVEQVFIKTDRKDFWKIFVKGVEINGIQEYFLAANKEILPTIFVVQSPLNRSYGTTSIHFNLTTNKVITNAFVSVNNGANQSLANDTLYHWYNTSFPTFSEGIYNVTFYVNDTEGNIETEFLRFTVDLTPPLWQSQGKNATIINPGEPIKLYAEAYDYTGLHYAILSTNETGVWENKTGYGSPLKLEPASNLWKWVNFTWQNSSIGGIIGWRIWINDTAGNWNVTSIDTFTQRINIEEPKAIISKTGTSYIDADDIDVNTTLNISALVFRSLSGNIDKVWVNITDLGGNVYGPYFLTNSTLPNQTGIWYTSPPLNTSKEFGNAIENYTISFYANDTTGLTQEIPAPTTNFYIQNITISLNLNATTLSSGEPLMVNGTALLWHNTTYSTPVIDTPVKIWIDDKKFGFFDNVENGDINWVTSNTTSGCYWHIVEHGPNYTYSPTHAWWYGNDSTLTYDCGSNAGTLTSINLTYTGGDLSFWYWYETETTGKSWDRRYVEISINGGEWILIDQLSGDSMREWHQKIYPLYKYAKLGDKISIRFRFDTVDDILNNYRGWYIDDIGILLTSVTDQEGKYNSTFLPPAGNHTLKVNITNVNGISGESGNITFTVFPNTTLKVSTSDPENIIDSEQSFVIWADYEQAWDGKDVNSTYAWTNISIWNSKGDLLVNNASMAYNLSNSRWEYMYKNNLLGNYTYKIYAYSTEVIDGYGIQNRTAQGEFRIQNITLSADLNASIVHGSKTLKIDGTALLWHNLTYSTPAANSILLLWHDEKPLNFFDDAGQTPTTLGNINQTQSYDAIFKRIYIYVFSEDNDTLDAWVKGWNGSAWITLANQTDGGSGVLIDKSYAYPIYTKIWVWVDDTEDNDNIYYKWNYTLYKTLTGPSGEYNYEFQTSPQIGIHSLRVYAFNQNGIDGENFTTYYTKGCGDGICDSTYGETCETCSQDCGKCLPPKITPLVSLPPFYIYEFSIELPATVELLVNESRQFEIVVKNTGNGTLTNLKAKVKSEPYCCVIGITPEKIDSLKPTNSTKFFVNIPAGIKPGNYQLIFNISSDQSWVKGFTQLIVKELPHDIWSPLLERLTGLFILLIEKEKEGYDVRQAREILSAAKNACDVRDYEKCISLLTQGEELLKKATKPLPLILISSIIIAITVIGTGIIAISKVKAKPPSELEKLMEKINSTKIEIEKVKKRGIDVSDCLKELELAEQAAKLGLKNTAKIHVENVIKLIKEKLS